MEHPRITETDKKLIDEWLSEIIKDPSIAFISHLDDEIRIMAMQTKQLLKEQQAVIECLKRKVKQFEYEKSWDECPDRMNRGGWT